MKPDCRAWWDWCGLLLVMLGIASLAAGASEQSSSQGPRPVASTTALALCQNWNTDGDPLVLVGPRLRWQRLANAGSAQAVGAEVVRLSETHPDLMFAVRANWVLVYDRTQGGAVRVECASGQRSNLPLVREARQIDISEQGDVAAMSAEAISVVSGGPSRTDDVPSPVEVPRESQDNPADLLWFGRRLMVFGKTKVTTIQVVGNAYSANGTPLPAGTADVRHAFTVNGLTYVLRDGCMDIHVGPSLATRLMRSACFGGGAFFGANSEELWGLQPGGTIAWRSGRPTVASVQISGTAFEITAAVGQLAATPWIPSVPLMLDSSAGAVTPTPDTAPWQAFIESRSWQSNAAFQAGMAAVRAKGWSDTRSITRTASSLEGPGVSLRWRPGFAFIKPAGRTLTQIAAQFFAPQFYYNPAQVNAIWDGSSDLAESLEGRLFKSDWISTTTTTPVPAMETMGFKVATTTGATATHFVQRDLLKSSYPQVGPVYECQPSGEGPAEIVAALGRGVPVAGGLGLLSAERAQTSRLEMTANGLSIVRCSADGFVNTLALVAHGVRLRVRGARNDAVQSRMADWTPGLRIRPSASLEWPWELDSPLVVGTRAENPMGIDQKPVLLGPWMDALLPMYGGDVLVPVTTLEMSFVARRDWQRSAVRIANARMASAESSPAQARTAALPCVSEQDALAIRGLHETMMKLDPSTPAWARSVRAVLGIAENAVDFSSQLFLKSGGTQLWVAPNADGAFEAITTAGSEGMSLEPKHIKHGTQIAGLIAAQMRLRGILGEAPLAWVNAGRSPFDNLSILQHLANRKAIINVSQELSKDWNPIGPTGVRTAFFADRLLLVAAAANLDTTVHGAPLDWHAPNVLGVGVADEAGNVLAGAPYSRDVIDLLAPGRTVPMNAMTGGIECDDGTSYATAYVTSVAALLSEAADTRHPLVLKARLLATAEWRSGYNGLVKGGLINARRALQLPRENLVTLDWPGGNPMQLKAIVPDVGGGMLKVTGSPGGSATRQEFNIDWRNILRLKRLPVPDGLANTTPALYRIAFVHKAQFLVLDDVAIPQTALLPFTSCTTLTNAAMGCEKMSVQKVVDYVAAVYKDELSGF